MRAMLALVPRPILPRLGSLAAQGQGGGIVPSPHKKGSNMEALVSIRISDYLPELEEEGKIAVVDLNCVDMNINPQTLAMLLDFLKISPGASSDRVVRGKQAVNDFLNEMGDSTKIAAAESTPEENHGRRILFQVKEWNVTLHKKNYPLALFRIEEVTLHLSSHPQYIDCQGRMGNLSIHDQSPTAGLYREKFTILGQEALQFELRKYKAEDKNLERSCDSTLQLHLSSIRYVHTKRFLAETLAFLDHFMTLDTSLQVKTCYFML
eukprot:sb/3468314/